MATIIRPPLSFPPQQKRPIAVVDYFSRPLTLGINPNAQIKQLIDSAPSIRRSYSGQPDTWPLTLGIPASQSYAPASADFGPSPQPLKWNGIDLYPNLLTSTLGQVQALALPLLIEQLDDGAPLKRRGQIFNDAYPNLLSTTLAPAQSPFQLPLSAIRWDWNAPTPKWPVQLDNYQNPVIKQAIPKIQRWDANAPYPKTPVWIDEPLYRSIALNPVPQIIALDQSAPPRKTQVRFDDYPNTLARGINPNASPIGLYDSATPLKAAVRIDIYPNLSVSTLLTLLQIPDVTGETQAQALIDLSSFTVSVQTDYSATVAVGLVISQAPIGGTFAQAGSIVSILVSLGLRPSQTGAGRRRRRRYFVEIDGQEFDVDNAEEAQALIDQAKMLATQVIRAARASIVVKPGLKVPQIRTPNKELVPLIKQARQEIRTLYDDLKRDLEIRSFMAKADEDEEEAIIRLLM